MFSRADENESGSAGESEPCLAGESEPCLAGESELCSVFAGEEAEGYLVQESGVPGDRCSAED